MPSKRMPWVLSAAFVAFGVAGCGLGGSLDNQTAAAVILKQQLGECAARGSSPFNASFSASMYTRDPSVAARGLDWVARLEKQPGTEVLSKANLTFGSGVREKLTYDQNGHPFFVDAFLDDRRGRMSANITTCAFEATAVEILDITLDGTKKVAHVTYRLEARPSRAPRELQALGLDTDVNPVAGEYRAVLRYLDAIGWRYEDRGWH